MPPSRSRPHQQALAWLLASHGLLGCGSPDVVVRAARTVDPCYEPYLADLRSVDRGRCATTRRACGDCHQSAEPSLGVLSGQDAPRLGTMAYPANLTPDVETGLGAWSSDQIVFAVRTGLDETHAALCFAMPRFDDMGDDEAYAIAHYLKSLPTVRHEVPPSSCPPVKPRAPAERDLDGGRDTTPETSPGEPT